MGPSPSLTMMQVSTATLGRLQRCIKKRFQMSQYGQHKISHSRFLPMFQVTSEAGIQRLVHKIEAETDKPFQNQKKVPIRMADNKKVMKI
jgi:hypothetical protein